MRFFRTKSLDALRKEASQNSLKKSLGPVDLLFIGLGAIIGTGIFVVTGVAAARYAGPAITVSYAIAGLACVFTALAYAELAGVAPVSGGAYTYAYLVLGEGMAWVVGCCVLMICTIGAATVASGWSGYMVGILESVGVHLPHALTHIPSEGGIVNLPAIFIACLICLFLITGTKETAKLNGLLVVIKLGAIFIFLAVAMPSVNFDHWDNFAPFGFGGVATGAATIFMSYSGFDTVASAAEECKNPNRDLPIGIIGSLVLSALLYVVVSGALTAIVPYSSLNNAEPMAFALRANGSNIGSALVATGAIAGMTTVIMMQMYGQSRVLFVMARDGLIPNAFSKLHRRFDTPYVGLLVSAVVISAITGFTPTAKLGQLTSMSTLAAFISVSVGVILLRIRRPDLYRTFRCPLVFIVAPLAVLSCGYLFVTLLKENWMEFILPLIVGLAVYFIYGSRHSTMVIDEVKPLGSTQ